MKRLDHPHIVKLYEIIDNPSLEKLYLVMPVADYGESIEWDPSFNPQNIKPKQQQVASLEFDDFEQNCCPSGKPDPIQEHSKQYLFHPNHRLQARNINKKKKGRIEDAIFYDEEQIRKMARCLIDALDYLHNTVNIVHRDIKPSNVLLDEGGAPLLVDFGKAVALSGTDLSISDFTTSIEGTYMFLPPECCSMVETVTKPYSMKKADVWALGMTLYVITFNRFPYDFNCMTNGHCTTELDIMEAIANVNVQFPESDRRISPELKALLSMMLEKEPSRRLDISEIKSLSRFINEPAPVKTQVVLSSSSQAFFGCIGSSSPQSIKQNAATSSSSLLS